jgi:hypothetical protein
MDPMEVHWRRLDKELLLDSNEDCGDVKEKAARRAPDGSFHFEETA